MEDEIYLIPMRQEWTTRGYKNVTVLRVYQTYVGSYIRDTQGWWTREMLLSLQII